MLAALPGGRELLSGVSPEEEDLYLAKGPALGQWEAVRAIRALGGALEHMARGSDQRIELELALFNLTAPDAQPAPATRQRPRLRRRPAARPQPAAQPPAGPSGLLPAARSPPPSAEAPAAQPAPQTPSPAAEAQPDPANLPPLGRGPPRRLRHRRKPPLPGTSPWPPPPAEEEAAPPPVEDAAGGTARLCGRPQLDKPRRVAGRDINPYPQWPEVVDRIRDTDPCCTAT